MERGTDLGKFTISCLGLNLNANRIIFSLNYTGIVDLAFREFVFFMPHAHAQMLGLSYNLNKENMKKMTYYLSIYSVPECFFYFNYHNCIRDGVVISVVDISGA